MSSLTSTVRKTLWSSRTIHGARFSATGWRKNASTDTGANVQAIDSDLDLELLSRRSYLYTDTVTPDSIDLLQSALKTYLPIQSHVNANDPKWMHLGHQHAYARPFLSDEMLCKDGTDDKFLPGPEDVWKYRLWAGGSVTQCKDVPVNYDACQPITLFEHASDIRVINQDSKASKVFVTIERLFSPLAEVLRRSTTQILPGEQPSKDVALHRDTAFLSEIENICFLRDPPKSLQDERRVKPPSEPLFSHTITPKEHLLFQFSALTYNAHRIHLDRDFARQNYGARNLVVHGPLTQVLLVEFLLRCMGTLPGSENMLSVPRSINYTNLKPLYVDEPLRLCCKPMKATSERPPDMSDRWQVWIEKGSGEDASCAVKASIDVDRLRKTP